MYFRKPLSGMTATIIAPMIKTQKTTSKESKKIYKSLKKRDSKRN